MFIAFGILARFGNTFFLEVCCMFTRGYTQHQSFSTNHHSNAMNTTRRIQNKLKGRGRDTETDGG